MRTSKSELIARFFKKYRKNLTAYAMDNVKVKAKSGKTVPMAFNDAQEHIHNKLEEQRSKIGKVRALLLKGRQQGGSTYVACRFYHRTTMNIGLSTFILSHEAATTGQLYDMVKRIHNNVNPIVRAVEEKSNAKELKFKSNDASYFLGTARNKELGRGFTAHNFHGSEAAFWPWGDEIIAGVINTIPPEDDTEIIFESTANGATGKFYEMCMLAKKPMHERNEEEKSFEYILIFVPWYWQREYRSPAPKGFKRTTEERALAKLLMNHPDGDEYKHKLTDEQLYWRRKKISEGGRDKFKQEYPSYVEEAFLFSGRPVFDPNDTQAAMLACREPVKRYEVTGTGSLYERDVDGRLQVWTMPKKGQRYVIGGDVAEGLAHGDYSSLDVLNEAGRQVASWHGHCHPKELAHIAKRIAEFYNNAFIGIERNNHGFTTVTHLAEELGYKNVFIERELEKNTKRTLRRYGWLTTSKSKPFIIDNLSMLLREGDAGIRSFETIEEMRRFIVNERGGYEADTGRCDDRVMSIAIAHEMLRQLPEQVKQLTDSGYRGYN
jgi:hypothetical protein